MDVTYTCRRCGSDFQAKVSSKERPNPQFCGRSCYYASMREFGRPILRKSFELTCEHCKGSFTVNKVRDRANRRFCSCKCRAAWQASLPFADWRGKLSANRANRPRGPRNPRFGKPPLHPGKAIPYVTQSGATIRFRSSWEVEVARYLDRHGIEWEYEPRRFDLGNTTYVPDFYLVEQKCFWEVKGWFHEKAKAKIATFREMYPEETVVLITKHVFPMISNDNHKFEERAIG